MSTGQRSFIQVDLHLAVATRPLALTSTIQTPTLNVGEQQTRTVSSAVTKKLIPRHPASLAEEEPSNLVDYALYVPPYLTYLS